jgi:transposase
MERYTEEQRVIIVKTHYKYGESYAETVSQVRGIFGQRNAQYQSTVQRMIKKFEETGSIMDSKLPVRHRTGRSLDNIAPVTESVAESPGTSIRHRSQQLDIPRSTTQRILTKDLHLRAYKIQLPQELKPTDHCCEINFLAVSSHAMAIRIGHRGRAI